MSLRGWTAIAWPFVGAWSIWLGGYLVLLGADLALRRSGLEADGITAHPLAVLVPVTVLGGAAARSSPISASSLSAQVPAAYVSAVSLGYTYLCLFGDGCP